MTKDTYNRITDSFVELLLLAEKEEDIIKFINAEAIALEAASAAGWNWEEDYDLVRYCLKATTKECCEATIRAFDKWAAVNVRE